MESSELALYRGLGSIRNYGILALIALFTLNAVALRTLYWVEMNDIQNELVELSEKLPSLSTTDLPAGVIAFQTTTSEHIGFYETSVEGKSYLAYADSNNKRIVMKSIDEPRREILNFALIMVLLYAGELLILLSWWFLLRSKIRRMFEVEELETPENTKSEIKKV